MSNIVGNVSKLESITEFSSYGINLSCVSVESCSKEVELSNVAADTKVEIVIINTKIIISEEIILFKIFI